MIYVDLNEEKAAVFQSLLPTRIEYCWIELINSTEGGGSALLKSVKYSVNSVFSRLKLIDRKTDENRCEC